MKGRIIYLYVEGGETRDQKAELRNGLQRLLTPQMGAARRLGISLRIVPCGGRDETFKAFHHATAYASASAVLLLVDSENVPARYSGDDSTDASVRVQHLADQDGWDFSGVDPEVVHLMVVCMESWIVADAAALARFFGREFRERNLPARQDLESEQKSTLFSKLESAIRNCPRAKNGFSKSNHAAKLLAELSPDLVAARCPRFAVLQRALDALIALP